MTQDFQARVINNRYALIPKPRIGGMADVFAASDLLDGGRKVAVKLLRYSSGDEAILAESFRRETDALRRLEHPNIVRLLDVGQDAESGRSYLVLEWLDQDLADRLKKGPFESWDDFYTEVGRPILSGLEFAHARRFSHRDIKPGNILLGDGVTPKLADFGIAKLHAFMTPGLTLGDFASKPFAPPEPEDGRHIYTRDIYGFAVVAVRALVGRELLERSDVEKGADDIELPPGVRGCIEQCLALDPARRPAHGGVLLAQLEAIQQQRHRELSPRRVCWIRIRIKDGPRLMRSLGVKTDAEFRTRIVAELKGPCAIEPYVFKNDIQTSHGKPHYLIHASTCRIHASVEDAGDRLFVFNAWEARQSDCERARETAWDSPFRFKVDQPPTAAEGEEAIRLLQIGVEEHQASLRVLQAQREEQRLFATWGSLLRARLDLERDRNPPIRFRSRRVDRQRVEFEIEVPPQLEWESEPWRIRLPDNTFVTGELEIVGDSVALSVIQGDPEQIPLRGRLELDASASEAALNRQQFVLDTVRFGRAIHPTLRELLIHPAESRPPVALDHLENVPEDLDDAKRDALRRCLGVQDFVAVEGPPGTGKTTFIVELVIQLLRRDPAARILLTSQTHVALDNALERIRKRDPQIAMVRVASRHAVARVATAVKPLMLESALEKWRKESLKRAEAFVESWAAARGISPQDTKVGLLLQRIISTRLRLLALEAQLRCAKAELDAQNSARKAGQGTGEDQIDLLEDEASRLAEDLRIEKKLNKELQEQVKRGEAIGEELLALSDDDLQREVGSYLPNTPTAQQLRTLIELQDEWADRFGKTSEFAVALLTATSVVAGTCLGVMNIRGSDNLEYDFCIVDEASKATPTEVLVPLSRSRRFIVVGDPRQLSPFQDPEIRQKGLLEKYRESYRESRRAS